LSVVRGVGIDGINGAIRFDADGYWANAPVFIFRYVDGVLTLAD
jgi:hypothetical protein